MSKITNPSYRDEDYEGCVSVGLPAGVTPPPLSDEEIRLVEEAWNKLPHPDWEADDGFVGSGRPPTSLLYGPPLSEQELKWLEEAWNNTAAYNAKVFAYHEALAAKAAQGQPEETLKPVAEPRAAEKPRDVSDEHAPVPH